MKPSDVSVSVLPSDFDRAPMVGNAGPRVPVHDDWTFDVAHLFGPRRLVVASASKWSVEAVRIDGVDVTDDDRLGRA